MEDLEHQHEKNQFSFQSSEAIGGFLFLSPDKLTH